MGREQSRYHVDDGRIQALDIGAELGTVHEPLGDLLGALTIGVGDQRVEDGRSVVRDPQSVQPDVVVGEAGQMAQVVDRAVAVEGL